MPSRCLLRITVALAALALAACGDDGVTTSTGDDYAASLDASCQQLFDEVRGLPQRQQDEGLSSAEVGDAAREADARFEDQVGSLQPPASLRPDHERLLDLIATATSGNDLQDFRARSAALIAIYDDLGADGCRALQERTLRDFKELGPTLGS